MLFNSLTFLIFFPLVTIIYFLLPHRARWAWLLAASCYFYMFFKAVYILILFFTIIIDYFAGILLENEKNAQRKKWWLIASLIANIGVLAVFKYFNFLNGNLSGLCTFFGSTNPIPYLSILLPIGLSFHTFQAMSYTIEVYRGNQKAERHFGIYALYVMFYPQLVAGPIERPQNMLHQFYEKHVFDYARVVEGLRLMLWGMFKKVVIADRLTLFVDPVYNHPNEYHGFQTILATIFFSFQIFCDFSGYSDIALGSAKVMGFDLMVNFNRPYFSKSISEFWKRWHISLSTWFRDYLYISLGGNRVSKPRTYFNQFITFMISGLWHGANWTFVIWGSLHGAYLVFGEFTKKFRGKLGARLGLGHFPLLNKLVQVSSTFVLATFAWIFFRAASFTDAITIIKNSLQISKTQLGMHILGTDAYNFVLCFIFIGIMEMVHWFLRKGDLNFVLNQLTLFTRWTIYILFVLFVINFGMFGDHQFIYFQF
ncbi:MAG: MBOAT family protein [Bacteroidetes bacterium]|nr:MBOAT family protein [Bacteroidota bacterium]